MLLSPSLNQMYEDAVFVGLIRDGLALCESWLRHGTFDSADKCGRIYSSLMNTMLDYENQWGQFFIVKFEEILDTPKSTILKIYRKCGLDKPVRDKIRLKVKSHYDKEGEYQENQEIKKWFDWAELADYFNPEINEIQKGRLDDSYRGPFLQHAGSVMEKIGYFE